MSAERITPPLPDDEDLPIEVLERRIRALTAEQVREQIAYEENHDDRAEVLEVLHDRLVDLEEGTARTAAGTESRSPEYRPEQP